MSMSLHLELPLPPTLNQSYFCVDTGGGVRMVLTDRARAYKEMAEEVTLVAWKERGIEIDQETHFTLHVITILEKNNRDVDANIKLLMDAIMSGVKLATDLDGLSDLRVYAVTLEKRVLGTPGTDPGVGLYVRLRTYQPEG